MNYSALFVALAVVCILLFVVPFLYVVWRLLRAPWGREDAGGFRRTMPDDHDPGWENRKRLHPGLKPGKK